MTEQFSRGDPWPPVVPLFDRLPPVPQDRTFAVTFGQWGGFYRRGRRGFWRVCFGFVAVTYFRAEFTQVVAAWLDRTDGSASATTTAERSSPKVSG